MPNHLCEFSVTGLLLLFISPLSVADEDISNLEIDESRYFYEEASDYEDEDEAFEWEVSIGLGYFVSQTPYVGGERQSDLIPYFSLSWGPLFFDGDSIGSYIYGGDNWGVSGSLSAGVLNDSERGDSSNLSDMTPLNDVVMVSLTFETEASWGGMEASLSNDVSDEHNGTSASVTYSYPVYFERWSLMPLVGVDWFDKKIARYYYGVNAENANASRALYVPNSGINYSAGLNASYDVNDNNSVTFTLLTEFYSKEIKQSSIVDKSHASSVGVVYAYVF